MLSSYHDGQGKKVKRGKGKEEVSATEEYRVQGKGEKRENFTRQRKTVVSDGWK